MVNYCGFLTRLVLKRDWHREYPNRLHEIEESPHWPHRDYTTPIVQWTSLSLMAVAILIIPAMWVAQQLSPVAAAVVGAMLILVPVSGIVSMVEVYIRVLLRNHIKGFGRINPQNMAWLACPHTLLTSSLLSLASLPLLFHIFR